jgi:hypothetical protein
MKPSGVTIPKFWALALTIRKSNVNSGDLLISLFGKA